MTNDLKRSFFMVLLLSPLRSKAQWESTSEALREYLLAT